MVVMPLRKYQLVMKVRCMLKIAEQARKKGYLRC